MPRWFLFIIIGLLVVFFVEFYSFQAIKALTKNKIIQYSWFTFSFVLYANFFITILLMEKNKGQSLYFQYALAGFLVAIVPKLIIIFVLLGEDVVRYVQKVVSINNNVPGRRKFVSQIALGLASIPLMGLIYGIFKGKYNYKVIKYQLPFSDLPEAFDGFTITHITDIHSGSFDNREQIQYGVNLINEQKSDVILFTGDLVNNFAYEMDDWIEMFSKLEAKKGKYSVLGNHDYGDYSEWESPESKQANFDELKEVHPKIGFKLLLNENKYLEKDGQKIALVGVENWGKGFKKLGDLEKASQGISKDDFKILMSHDPSHWEKIIKKDDFNYQLTLSGHTHGLQFGIEIPGFIKWSPAKYVYKQWAGLYHEYNRYINVNRGFGYHAFPGRVGIWPEITVIELKKV